MDDVVRPGSDTPNGDDDARTPAPREGARDQPGPRAQSATRREPLGTSPESDIAVDPPPFLERRATDANRPVRPPTPRVALLIGAVVLVGILMYMGREALTPFVVGLLIVYLLDPPVERLARLGLPRWLAVLLVYIVATVIVFEALNLTLRPLVDQIATFVQDLPALTQSLDAQLRRLSEFYRGLELPPQLREAIDGWIAGMADGDFSFDPAVLLPVVNVAGGLVGALFGYLLIPVWMFYLLKDRPALTRAFDNALPSAWRADAWQVIRIVERVFRQWVRAQLFLGVTVGVATFLGLLLLGAIVDPVFTRFAVLLAIIAGLLELLPIIGPIIAAVPAVLLAATAGVEAVVAALLLYLVVQQVENNVLVPKIQGEAVELHASVVMFALVVGGAVAGLLGAILALPFTAAGRDVFRYLFKRLSPTPPTPAEAAAESIGSPINRAGEAIACRAAPGSVPAEAD